MNDLDARAMPAPCGRYHGQYRMVHRADYETVERDGKPALFKTRDAAELAGWRMLKKHLMRHIVGEGVRPTIDAAVRRVFPAKRGRRPVEVVVR